MFAADHLQPHFHVKYAENEATINIETGDLIKGFLANKQLRLVQAWVEIHRDELRRNYETLNAENQSYNKIKPLE